MRAPAGRPSCGARAGGGDRADLAGADAEAARVERAAERQLDLAVAVPAELDDRALGREQVERSLQPGGRRAGVHDQVASRRRRRPAARSRRRARRRPRPGRIDVDERDLRPPGTGSAARATQQPTMPAPTTVTRSPSSGRRVPQRVDGGLDGAREHGAGGRHVLGHDGHRAGRHHVGGLVRVQAEDGAAAQLRRVPARPRRR